MPNQQNITAPGQKGKIAKRILKILLAVALFAALIFAFLPEPIRVDLAQVDRQDVVVTIEGEGKTRIHDIYIVSAPIEGRVTRIQSEAGDHVTAGKTVIANMHPANPRFLDRRSETQAKADVEGARAARALANARVKQVKANLEFDLADFKRTQELYKTNTVSKANLERAELRLKTLRAELETAESNLQVMQSRLEAAQARLLQPSDVSQDTASNASDCQICIYSPVDGQLLKVIHKNESVVSVGTPLVEVGNAEDLEVVIELLSTNAVQVKVGDRAFITRWGGNENINTEVKLIEPAGFTKISALGVEEQRVNVVLRFTDSIDKWKSLGHAFRVEAEIIIDQAENVVTVPISALFRENEQWSVFKVVDGIAQLTKVEIGLRNDRIAQVTNGLIEGDLIIVHPGNDVGDGVKVTAR
ncbi:MAG: HlyD family efflux transporter periplasmic adaptor subunit [Kangiellaceae bacterium]|jgi:HlyD family secretion protein